mmetsp:Transcript_29042/g.69302  ORF Transcript_29042/g.69302 Transcript_29042/m.69302 type:complete len:245 (+) Transcript_29042:39-773(+)
MSEASSFPKRVLFKCGHGTQACEDWELQATALVNMASNLCMLPAIVRIWQQELRWEAVSACLSVLTSLLYHLCETTGMTFFSMNDGQWHRLDNIGAVICFTNLFIYLSDIRDVAKDQYTKFSFLALVLILQERGPWELKHTVWPIVLSLFVPLISHGSVRRRPDFNYRTFVTGLGILSLAFVFFAHGLDDNNDYLRFSHALWHVFVGVSAFYLWASVPRHAVLLSRQEKEKEKERERGGVYKNP